jgi:hypothetical protein
VSLTTADAEAVHPYESATVAIDMNLDSIAQLRESSAVAGVMVKKKAPGKSKISRKQFLSATLVFTLASSVLAHNIHPNPLSLSMIFFLLITQIIDTFNLTATHSLTEYVVILRAESEPHSWDLIVSLRFTVRSGFVLRYDMI